ISWSVGLFFLVASEIITVGSTNIPVNYGIGIAVASFAGAGDYADYTLLVAGLVLAVIVWRFLFLREFALWSEKYKMMEEPREQHRDPIMRIYSWVNQRSISKLFLLTQGRGVNRFTSVISRFRRGIKYAVLIVIGLFFLLVLESIMKSGALSLGHLP